MVVSRQRVTEVSAGKVQRGRPGAYRKGWKDYCGVALQQRDDRSSGLVERCLDPGDVGEKLETLAPGFVKTVFAERKSQTAAGRQPFQRWRRDNRHWARG